MPLGCFESATEVKVFLKEGILGLLFIYFSTIPYSWISSIWSCKAKHTAYFDANYWRNRTALGIFVDQFVRDVHNVPSIWQIQRSKKLMEILLCLGPSLSKTLQDVHKLTLLCQCMKLSVNVPRWSTYCLSAALLPSHVAFLERHERLSTIDDAEHKSMFVFLELPF